MNNFSATHNAIKSRVLFRQQRDRGIFIQYRHKGPCKTARGCCIYHRIAPHIVFHTPYVIQTTHPNIEVSFSKQSRRPSRNEWGGILGGTQEIYSLFSLVILQRKRIWYRDHRDIISHSMHTPALNHHASASLIFAHFHQNNKSFALFYLAFLLQTPYGGAIVCVCLCARACNMQTSSVRFKCIHENIRIGYKTLS